MNDNEKGNDADTASNLLNNTQNVEESISRPTLNRVYQMLHSNLNLSIASDKYENVTLDPNLANDECTRTAERNCRSNETSDVNESDGAEIVLSVDETEKRNRGRRKRGDGGRTPDDRQDATVAPAASAVMVPPASAMVAPPSGAIVALPSGAMVAPPPGTTPQPAPDRRRRPEAGSSSPLLNYIFDTYSNTHQHRNERISGRQRDGVGRAGRRPGEVRSFKLDRVPAPRPAPCPRHRRCRVNNGAAKLVGNSNSIYAAAAPEAEALVGSTAHLDCKVDALHDKLSDRVSCVVLYLPKPVVCDGQLYVALSRGNPFKNIKVEPVLNLGVSRSPTGAFALSAPAAVGDGPNRCVGRHAKGRHDGKYVSWVRRKSDDEPMDLLTTGTQKYTADDRYSARFIPPDIWRLEIKGVRPTDAAHYDCQLSAHPPRTARLTLRVPAAPRGFTRVAMCLAMFRGHGHENCEVSVRIVDGAGAEVSEQVCEEGSTVALRCEVRGLRMEGGPALLWRRRDATLNDDTTRGGISVRTEFGVNGANSVLRVARVRPDDAGRYSCSVARAPAGDLPPAHVVLHVIKEPRRIHFGPEGTRFNPGKLSQKIAHGAYGGRMLTVKVVMILPPSRMMTQSDSRNRVEQFFRAFPTMYEIKHAQRCNMHKFAKPMGRDGWIGESLAELHQGGGACGGRLHPALAALILLAAFYQ
ncbi:hypothetical protein EVAR_81516_1 [Eumeta japonica]|uniref:Ig-like domain-containing protein n=1 Tax=Eumeta variegata TaxID=151549 RepID=A0A4C1W0D8_EUMVA|nr:hypothetical protein EVAR_81516_1 [Eumeta japonica]